MKIALIGHKRIPGRSGGVEVVVEELAVRLVARGFDVVAYNRADKAQRGPSEFQGVRVVDIPTPATKNLNAVVYSYLATLRAILDGVDLIHYHALGPAASIWLAKLFGKRCLVTVHGLNYKTPKWRGLGARYIRLGERLTAKHADEVIVLSKSIQSYIKYKYNRDARFVPNGLSMPEDVDDDSVLDRLGLRGKDFLLCVSRLVPGKGLDVLVEAYKGVKTAARLVIVGDGDHNDGFKGTLKASAAEDPRILFPGFLEKDDLCTLYKHAGLFVFPSEAEGMPMSLLEAMWFDCPCLVSDIPENIEVLEGHGATFHVGDAVDLREKLRGFVDPFVGREDTRSIVHTGHDWDVVTDMTADIYEEILA